MLEVNVFHGRENHSGLTKDVVFFSSSEDFSKEYGAVQTYQLTLSNPFDTSSQIDVTNLLRHVSSLTDSYDGEVYTSFQEIDNAGLIGSDTWELFEAYMRQIKSLGYDGMVIYEGGIENYVSFHASQYRRVEDVCRKLEKVV